MQLNSLKILISENIYYRSLAHLWSYATCFAITRTNANYLKISWSRRAKRTWTLQQSRFNCRRWQWYE